MCLRAERFGTNYLRCFGPERATNIGLAFQVLVEPGDGFLLGLTAGLVVDAVVLDALDRYELLDPGGPLVGQDRVFLVTVLSANSSQFVMSDHIWA